MASADASVEVAQGDIQDAVVENESEQPRVVHGVPVDAWVLSRRDKVKLDKVPPPAPSQLRFFVQCMELKGGQTSELQEKECRELAQRTTPTRPNRF